MHRRAAHPGHGPGRRKRSPTARGAERLRPTSRTDPPPCSNPRGPPSLASTPLLRKRRAIRVGSRHRRGRRIQGGGRTGRRSLHAVSCGGGRRRIAGRPRTNTVRAPTREGGAPRAARPVVRADSSRGLPGPTAPGGGVVDDAFRRPAPGSGHAACAAEHRPRDPVRRTPLLGCKRACDRPGWPRGRNAPTGGTAGGRPSSMHATPAMETPKGAKRRES